MADNLAISLRLEAEDAASPAMLRAVAAMQALQQATAPAQASFQQLQQTAQQSGVAIAQSATLGSQAAVRAAQEQAREQIRAATDAARELQRLAADQGRQAVQQAREAVRIAPGPLSRDASRETLAAAQELAREQQRLAADTGRAQVRAAQDAGRQTVQAARDATGQASSLRQGLGQALQGAGRGVLSETVGGGLLIAGGLGVAAGVAAATREAIRFGTESFAAFAQFDLALRQAQALLGQTGQTANVTFRQMNQDVLSLSSAMGVSAVGSARAMYQVLSSGVQPGIQAMTVLREATKASIGNFVDQATATRALTAVMNAYHASAQDVPRINDEITRAVQLGQFSWAEYSAGVGRVIALNQALGLSHAELAGFVANAAKNGVQAAEAFTDYGAILQAVSRPSEEARRMAQALRLEFTSQELAAKGLAGFLQEVSVATDGNVDMMARLFGSMEAARGAMVSTGANAAGLAIAINSVKDSAGTADAAMNTVNQSATRNLNELTSRWEAFRIQSVQAAQGHTEGVAAAMNAAADQMDIEGAAIQRLLGRWREYAAARNASQEQRQVEAGTFIGQQRPAPQTRGPQMGPPTLVPRQPTEEDDLRRQNLEGRGTQTSAILAAEAAAQAQSTQTARQRIADSVAAAHATEDAARAAQRAQQDAQQAEETAARERQRGVQSLQEAATTAARALQDVQDRLSQNQESLNQWLQAPIRGTRELEEALGRVQDRIAGSDLTLAQTRYEQIRARIEGAPPPTIDIDALRQAAMTRALASAEGDVLTARGRVELDPLDRARRLAAARPEVSGPEAIANVQNLAPQVFADQATIQQRTPAIQAAQRAAQDAALAAQRQEQAARDRLQGIQRDAQAAQHAAQDYAAATQRAQEIAQEGGQPTTARTPEQQARLDQLTQAATAAAQRAQEASAAFQAQYAVGRAAVQGAAGQLLLPSTIGTGPAAWQGQRAGGAGSFAPTPLLPPTMTFNFGDFNFPQGGLSADQIKAIAKAQSDAAIDKFVDEGLAQAPGPAAAPTLAGSKR
jgi:TP901 family phage tail tape measure protein